MSVAVKTQASISESHFVHFYRDEKFLSGALLEFIRLGVEKKDGIVVVATESHIAELCRALDINIVSHVRFVDARWALKNIYQGHVLKKDAFSDHVMNLIIEMRSHYKTIRIFSETVNLLCEENRVEAALELEEYWNGILQSYPETLMMCGYNLKYLSSKDYQDILDSHFYSSGNEDVNYSLESLCQKVTSLEIKNLENQMQQKKSKLKSEIQQRALHLNKLSTIGEITAGIAHEMMNPITIINGYAETIGLVLNEEEFESKEFVKKQLDTIHSTIHRMSYMMKNILKYSEPDRDKSETFSVSDVIQDTINLLKPSLNSNNISVIFKRPEYEIFMEGSSNHLIQVLFNLINNSKDAIMERELNQGGIIRVKIGAGSGRFKIEVEDNGSGMDKKVVENLWKPFYTTKRPGHGTGLGLYLIRKIIQDYQGTIQCYSVLNQGTKFTIVLPSVTEIGMT